LKPKDTKIVVFADLDGSVLTNKYESSEIEPIIQQLLKLNISIVFASSKTKSEIEFYRDKWQIKDPFIVENGSAILIPENYFKVTYPFNKHEQGYNIIELGTQYRIIREKIVATRNRTGANIVGFGDMTADEIVKDSGLPKHLAQLAKKREYSEPFIIPDNQEKEVLQAIRSEGLCYTKGGKYLHALGNCDKGKATAILKNLYLQQFAEILSIGVGDSTNDLAMLKIVDKSFYIHRSEDRKNVWKEIESIASGKTFRH
jgi:mannosyl-3-phosphoglycerate phosphatase